MPELCWLVGGEPLITGSDDLYLDLTEDTIAACEQQLRKETTKLEKSKWLVCHRDRLKAVYQYLDKDKFMNSSHKRATFDNLFKKYFIGNKREIEILRALRPDIFILLCFTFNKSQFETIFGIGLQDDFAKVINKSFKERWTIPDWVVGRAKTSMIKFKFKSEEAGQLRQSKLCVCPPQGPNMC